MGTQSYCYGRWRNGVLPMNNTVFLIPNLPTTKLVQEDGNPHPAWQQWFQQLVAVMQNNLSPNGFTLPQQPTTTITLLNTPASKGVVIYDETTDQFKGNVAGTFKVFTLT